MGHLEASATLPQRNSAAVRLLRSARRQGKAPSKGCRSLLCFIDDEGLWLPLPQPCDSHRPSFVKFADECRGNDVRIAR